MEKDQKTTPSNWIDQGIKLLTPLLSIVGVIIGVWQFQSQQRQTESLEFKRDIWKQRLDTYSKLSETTGLIIVYAADSVALDSLSKKYQKLYYGAMPMIQDGEVERSLVDFNLALIDFRAKIKDLGFLKRKQLGLMAQLGRSLKKTNDLIEP